ncbi:hypothetical protein [Dactylosporangium sp. NPDC005555]|uniref:CBU_0592 family membrane protein n=1 Tax=Dactylosporangium sp. NPDC005555 TaxID=3154889 RepID=UPI0033B6F4C3
MFVQILGSLCVLLPFVLVQLGRWSSTSRRYVWLNLIGSATLAVEAAIGHDWGFLLLESVWAIVSLRSLLRSRPDEARDAAGASSVAVGE